MMLQVIPVDKTGNFDMVYNFLKENWKIAKWVALGAVIFEVKMKRAVQPWDCWISFAKSIKETKHFCICIEFVLFTITNIDYIL